jgi:hypothetical protein
MASFMLHANSLPQRLCDEVIIFQPTYKKYSPIDISWIRPLARLGVASNWK